MADKPHRTRKQTATQIRTAIGLCRHGEPPEACVICRLTRERDEARAALKVERDTLWAQNQQLRALVRETILRLRSTADALDGRA